MKRYHMNNRWLYVLVLCLLTMSLTAGISTATSSKPITLTVALSNFGLMTGLPSRESSLGITVWDKIYDYLVYSPGGGRFKPGLATSWEKSADAKTWTFHLRKGVQFHDGLGELTAEDVKFTVNLIMKEGSKNSEAPELRTKLSSIEVIDPYTLRISYNVPVPDAPIRFSNYWCIPIVSKEYVEKVGEDQASNKPIGSGPFQFVERVPGSHVKFKAVKEHWRVVPDFDYLIIKAVPEISTRIGMLINGEADIVGLPPTHIAEVKRAGFRVKTAPSVYTTFMGFLGYGYKKEREGYNPDLPWWDIRVRKALNLAINRQELAEKIFSGAASPAAVMPFGAGSAINFLTLEPYPYDPDQAKKLLKDAGYEKLHLKIWDYDFPGIAPFKDMIEAVATYWIAIGVSVDLVPSTWTLGPRPHGTKRTLPPGRDAWIFPVRGSQSPFWTGFAHYWYGEKGGCPCSEDPEITGWVNALNATTDVTERNRAATGLAKYIYENYINVPLVHAGLSAGISEKIKEWEYMNIYSSIHFFENIKVNR